MEDRYNVWDTRNNTWVNYLEFRSLSSATGFCNALNRAIPPIGGPIIFKVKPSIKNEPIKGIPLDPTLPILEAGHLQDRAIKRCRQDKP